MLKIVSLLQQIAMVIFAALVAFDNTPEGQAMIDELLSEIEASGFDIPGWEPPAGEPMDMNVAPEAMQSVIDTLAARFAQRHPDIIQKSGG
jgi:hypothetical protein